jgi:hypothetical protein
VNLIPPMTDLLDFSNIAEIPTQKALERLLSGFDMVCFGGPMAGGKSFSLACYDPRDYRVTRWRRQGIYEMVRDDGHVDDRFHGAINKLEDTIIPELILDVGSKVVIEGYFRYERNRKRALKWAGNHRSAIIIFDGPDEVLLDRAVKTYNKSREDLEWDLKVFRDTFSHPSFNEGWTSIYYATTCGQSGVDHLTNKFGV